MKKIIYALILLMVVMSGFLFSNYEIKNEPFKKSILKTITTAEQKTALEKWKNTTEGIAYKKWEVSPAGIKVDAAEAKISKSIRDYTNIEAVVSSLTLPPDSRLGFGVMVRINGDDYILSFGQDFNNEFEQLYKLQVNDKIIIRSHSVSHAPKYSFPIIAGDYIERDGKIIYIHAPHKGDC